MMKYLFLVAIVVSASRSDESVNNINPLALEDQIRAELEELKSFISGHIWAAIGDVDYAKYLAYIFRDNRRKDAEITMGQHYQKLDYEVNQLKDLASDAGANIEQCLDIKPTPFQLFTQIVDTFPDCLNPYTDDVDTIRDSTAYKVDTTINEIHALEFQLDRCAGDILCLAPVATEMSLAEVRIPQNIGVELITAQELLDDRKVPVFDCMNDKIAVFVTEAATLFNIVSKCIDESID